jgi:arsenate reductase (glutaredoxin)
VSEPIVVWHNPHCSKSRGACALLEDRAVDVEVRRYLEEPPTRSELDALVAQLGLTDVREMVRTDEVAYRDLHLDDASDEEVLDAITSHPALLQRPIVVRGGKAVIARPPERLEELLTDDA